MDYDTPAGKRRTIATNFEPASERRFNPSWDEPSLKATSASRSMCRLIAQVTNLWITARCG
jgi:hypothetical protein